MEFHVRIMKIMKIMKCKWRIDKIMKIIKFLLDNNENQTTLRIQFENKQTTNRGNHRLSHENQENHETIELHSIIIQIMKILEFYMRITKIKNIL